MNVYAASSTSPIAGSATGTYATYFFVNGPYNVNAVGLNTNGTLATSTTQFCRQCHFGEANESNGGTLPTQF
jgi:nitrate/TMAO reductase-like tetraheme cytochrome c subunit